MSPETIKNVFLPVVAFLTGGCVGSFLNVVIYRSPLGISVNNPRRSFCPACKTQLPMWLNIPMVTWLMLRGKCKFCKAPFSFRYFAVELLTAILFLAVYRHFFQNPPSALSPSGMEVVVCFWIFIAMLVAATFIDFDHMIIPDSITIGGTVVGLIASVAIPEIHGETGHLLSLWKGVLGAAAGFALLWLVLNAGKLMFGRLKFNFDEPTEFSLSEPDPEENPVLKIGDFEQDFGLVFSRESDRLEMDVSEVELNGQAVENLETFQIFIDAVEVNGEKRDLEGINSISGKCTRAVIPREAMGFGDVKFMAMIGAFTGFSGVLFTVFTASIIGAVIGILQKTIGRHKWSRELPFGPYLALGAILFLFVGAVLIDWYFARIGIRS